MDQAAVGPGIVYPKGINRELELEDLKRQLEARGGGLKMEDITGEDPLGLEQTPTKTATERMAIQVWMSASDPCLIELRDRLRILVVILLFFIAFIAFANDLYV